MYAWIVRIRSEERIRSVRYAVTSNRIVDDAVDSTYTGGGPGQREVSSLRIHRGNESFKNLEEILRNIDCAGNICVVDSIALHLRGGLSDDIENLNNNYRHLHEPCNRLE
jgi:hypothetical protein